MTVLSYLFWRAATAIPSQAEDASIAKSLTILRTKLNLYLGYPTSSLSLFGSYRRKTILPRSLDPKSDVDFMVAFADDGYKPQTYLDRLRRFVETRYSRSEVYQSSPTIVLDLNHIRFEIVPALPLSNRDFLIPNGPEEWQATSPFEFHRYLEQRNKVERSMLKPAVRLLKYWNAQNGYPFGSFLLERWAVEQTYFGCQNLRDYFFSMIDQLPWQYDVQWKAERVNRAKSILDTVRDYEPYYQVTAEQEIKRLLPA